MANVLLIDDDSGNRDTLSRLLHLNGHYVTSASSGFEGAHAAIANTFDVILLDLRLPDCSGTTVLQLLKEHTVTSPVIIMTAFPDLDSCFDAAALGAAGYVDGLLLGDGVLNIVDDAISGRLPVRHPNHDCTSEPSPRAGNYADARVRRVISMINHDPNIHATELGCQVGLSESRLRHIFKAAVGISLAAFRRNRRLQTAAVLLSKTDVTMKEIRGRLGLADLTKAFRSKFGVPPREYRRRYSGAVIKG